MSSVANFIRREPKEKLNILTFPTHKRYETELAKTGHNFYAVNFEGFRSEDYGLDNYHRMLKQNFYPRNGYDLILSQDRFYQFGLANKINNNGLHLPIITLEHTVPTPELGDQTLSKMGQMVGDVNVFICDYSRDVWSGLGIQENNSVIKHSVDTDHFKQSMPRTGDYILTVANNFIDRDYCLNFSLWREVYGSSQYNMFVHGENASKINDMFYPLDGPELVASYSNCMAYLNTTSHSPIPMSLLEAMACECPVITTSTCGITEFVEDGVNGLIADTAEDIHKAIKLLTDNEDLGTRLGKAARETILDKCSTERFVENWKELFMKTYEASL